MPPKKNRVTDLRLKHIEGDIREIKESLAVQTEILEKVAVQNEKIRAIDRRLEINEKKVDKLQSKTIDRMWNIITIACSVIFSAIVGYFLGSRK